MASPQGQKQASLEFWTDYNPKTKRMEPVKMPLKYVKEMFCDRVAAGKIYLGKNYTRENPIEYFRRGNAKNVMQAETAKLLESWLVMLYEEGEEKTFAHIRKHKGES